MESKEIPFRPFRRTKRVLFGLGALFFLAAAIMLVFEFWRQAQISNERTNVRELTTRAENEVLTGKSRYGFLNGRIKGINGWSQFETALKLYKGNRDKSGSVLNDVENWWIDHHPAVGSRDLPREEVVKEWLSQSAFLAETLEEASRSQVVARVIPATANWEDAVLGSYTEFTMWEVMLARVKLLSLCGQPERAQSELVTLIRVASLCTLPLNVHDGLTIAARQESSVALAAELAQVMRFSRETLRAILACWPDPAPLLGGMIEGEIVFDCWYAETEAHRDGFIGEYGLNSHDGWFNWLPRASIEFAENGEPRSGGPFACINVRRSFSRDVLHLLDCLHVLKSGAKIPYKLPDPPLENYLPGRAPSGLDIQNKANRLAEYAAKVRWRKVAFQLRLIEYECPLGSQNEKVAALASSESAVLISFDRDGCLVSFNFAAFPTVHFDTSSVAPSDWVVRLKALD